MNRKKRNLIILIVTLILGLGTVLVLKTKRKTTTLEQNYNIEDTASITKIFMADKLNTKVLLEKKADGSWEVDKTYPAAQHAINMLTGTLHDMRIRQPVAIAAHANIIKSLAANGTKVEIYQKKYFIDWFGTIKLFPREKLTKVIYVGQETQDNQGTYMLVKGEKSPMIIYVPKFRGFLTPRFSTNPYTWRSHEIYNYDIRQIQSVKIDIGENPQESFEVVRNGQTFEMKMLSTGITLSQFDTAHVADLLASVMKVNFDKFVTGIPALERDSIFPRGPVFTVTVSDTAGNSKWVKTFIKLTDVESKALPTDKNQFYEIMDVNRMYGLVQGIPDTVILQYYVFDNILKPASYYQYQPHKSSE